MRRRIGGAFVVVGLVCGAVWTQGKIDREHAGRWQVTLPMKPQVRGNMSAADTAGATEWMNEIFEMLHAMPLLAQPKGFDVIPQAILESDTIDGRLAPAAPRYLYGLAEADLAQYEVTANGSRPDDRAAPATIRIEVNHLGPVIDGAIIGSEPDEVSDERGAFMKNPTDPDGTVHGYPYYQVNASRVVVLRRNNVPFFAPVSRERYLRYKIKATQAQLDKAQADWARNKAALTGIPNASEITRTMTEGLTRLQHSVDAEKKQLAGMSAADAGGPAYVDLGDESEGVKFVAKDDDSGTAIVEVNPALMDAKLPRWAPQIITVDIRTDTDNWPEIAATLDKQIDWDGLEKLLQQY